MGTRLVCRLTLPDGRVEEFLAIVNRDGYYTLADGAINSQQNLAVNQFFVKDLEVVAARLRRGGVSLRMRGAITGQRNLISAQEIAIEDEPRPPEPAREAKPEAGEDDPFATFDEWASPEDEAAYADL